MGHRPISRRCGSSAAGRIKCSSALAGHVRSVGVYRADGSAGCFSRAAPCRPVTSGVARGAPGSSALGNHRIRRFMGIGR